ncbi:hypothetical protein [Halarcobacter anaerophilus]|uniref:Uncharacterized protein n=1 Tax=Halarcobacter anaerophilus TaxID=877500 RepID=A0A4Q0XZU6_9BACT|nr:hypothetical protein [Halarcobacter anaerophilus]QDF28510.1 hypothetical protein AANAER_1024 [Halarcobacter anaerophilus]RXJ63240.1 hypothetical protein CRV06_06055 [Halarcobacter anaerophilus]
MKKIFIYGITALIFAGCTINNQPEKDNKAAEQEPVVKEEKVTDTKQKEIAKPAKKISFKFYEIVPSQIEVFPYNKLNRNTVINDKRLNNSFYVKGNFIRIERIYTSEIGDKYGKIAGKNLLVSMDDLAESNRKAY